jgi:hypothetical protein
MPWRGCDGWHALRLIEALFEHEMADASDGGSNPTVLSRS